jgi:serine protease Do
MIRHIHWPLAVVCIAMAAAQAWAQVDANDQTEKAMKDAAAKVAPSVVRIETSGGQDMIVWTDRATGAPIRKVVGPTTGLVVDADGYIITSSFNFINKPTAIFVTVHGKGRSVAKVVATDASRMLTLLKVDLNGLQAPEAYPKKEIEVGLWSLAFGRTLNPNVDQAPSISAGIISAVGRIWGKAVQTDAKVSPNNYGGPLVGIDGRVMGVLVPASPQSEGEQAGIEWYDSGIGFAIPLEDINRVLPKLKAGTADKPVNLRGGVFGIQVQPNQYLAPPVISQVGPESAAEKAGIKDGDLVVSVNGKPLFTMAQFLHVIKPLYEGDAISMKVKRGDKEIDIPKVVLQGIQTAIEPGFLGILPMRDDPAEGLEIRYVYPDSPAAKAGLKFGDRIMKVGPASGKELIAFAGRDRFLAIMSQYSVNTDMKLEVKRKDGGKTDTITARLVAFTEDVPEELPKESTKKKALEKPKNPELKKGPIKVDPKKGPPMKDEPSPDKTKKVEGKKEEEKNEEEKKEAKKDEIKKIEIKKIEIKKDDDKKDIIKKVEIKKDEAKKDDEKKDEAKNDEAKKEEAKKEKVETGLLKRSNPALGHKYWVYVPSTYDPNVAHALVVWLHPAGREGRDADDMVNIWEDFCEYYNLIMLGPISENKNGWVPTESEGVISDINAVLGEYTIDKQRVIVHGSGIGGQMAYYLGFNARDQVRGVATVGAVLASQPKDLTPNQRLQFYIAAGQKDPILKDIMESKPKLTERKYSVVLRVINEKGKEYLNESPDAFREMLRWLDSLDRN